MHDGFDAEDHDGTTLAVRQLAPHCIGLVSLTVAEEYRAEMWLTAEQAVGLRDWLNGVLGG
jgi:hypothetical protein